VKRALAVTACAVAAAVALPSWAYACVCADLPLRERLDAADAAVAGWIVSERDGDVNGEPVRLLTFDVVQQVKGGVPGTIVIRTPSGTDCDVDIPRNTSIGLLLTKAPDGAWLATACSVVSVEALVVEGGKPRGGMIKVVVGLFILGIVLLWALRRLHKGARPDLPGAPRA
jgi:hypothetical protein